MFRLHTFRVSTRRLIHSQILTRDPLLEQLKSCSAEDQVFSVVGQNKAKLSVDHVSCAIGLLWQFQIEQPQMLRTFNGTQNHPQFLTLRVLAENKISLMDDSTLVDTLYNVLRLRVEHHDTLVQQLVIEGWNRLERFQMGTLSKFAVCLRDMFMHHSPLMGQITQIVSQRLDSIQEAKFLTPLMASICSLVSPQLRDALLRKVETLLDTRQPIRINYTRRVVQFLRKTRYVHKPLLEVCSQFFLQNIEDMDMDDISIVLGIYQALQFSNAELTLAARKRLIKLMETSSEPDTFSKLFVSLGNIAGPGVRENLESSLMLLADELNPQQALFVVEAMEEMQCRNIQLINKMEVVIFKNLDTYRPHEIARITQALILLHCRNPEILSGLKAKLLHYLLQSVYPSEVTFLTRVLSMLPSRRLDEGVLSRVNAIIPQCNLNNLNTYSWIVAKWIRNDPSYRLSTPSKYVHLLQRLNSLGRERLRSFQQLDGALEEMKFVSGEWFEEILLQESVNTIQRLMDQISWTNVNELAVYLTRSHYLSAPLLDRITSVTIDHLDKIHYSDMHSILLPFAVLNYEPPGGDYFFEECVRHITPYIRSFDPHLLILLAHSLALVACFPEEVIREIFNVDFLTKLDAYLEACPESQNLHIRFRLMELNRAVCLECPEFHVPWFHERYCQQLHKRTRSSISPVQRQIHRILGEVLGGINCAKVAALTPYFYTVDFELVLDRHHRPVPFSEPNQLQLSNIEKVEWQSASADSRRTELPSGARRIALELLSSRSFCRNTRHLKGEAMMKKRHLEILGYHVLQIPHFEWNSMELSTEDAWKGYLREKIFMDML